VLVERAAQVAEAHVVEGLEGVANDHAKNGLGMVVHHHRHYHHMLTRIGAGTQCAKYRSKVQSLGGGSSSGRPRRYSWLQSGYAAIGEGLRRVSKHHPGGQLAD